MKFAAKLLTQSDLTLFEAYYRENGTSKQKGVNLNGDVLASDFYPALPDRLSSADEVPITLDIYGPAGAALHRLRRKIVKPVGGKNWRLNGKLIEEPSDQLGRYATLQPGDVAVMAFDGEPLPTSIHLIILSSQSAEDLPILALVREGLGLAPGGRRSMRAMPLALVEEAAALTPDLHPIRLLLPDFVRDEELQEAALGNETVARTLYTRTSHGRSRPVSPAELAAARQRATDIGRTGEVLVEAHLTSDREAGRIRDYVWDADGDALSPFDFTIIETDGTQVAVDVKSTTGSFTNGFHVSASELIVAASEERPYKIFRVYGIDSDSGAKLRRSSDISAIARQVLDGLEGLPAGVKIGSVELAPGLFEWAAEEVLAPLEDEG